MTTVDIDLGAYQLGWHDSEADYVFKPRKGLDEDIIRTMSTMKGEPDWMLQFRLKSYQRFLAKPIPTWGGGGALEGLSIEGGEELVEGVEVSGPALEDAVGGEELVLLPGMDAHVLLLCTGDGAGGDGGDGCEVEDKGCDAGWCGLHGCGLLVG